MTRDPTMTGGVGMMGSDDGVPYFGAGGGQHAGKRSGWPFLLQNVTLPAAVAQSPQNLHLHALVPAEYLTEGGGRVVASPHSLKAVTRLIAGDVEGLYQDGVVVDDASVAGRGRKRFFSALLLYFSALLALFRSFSYSSLVHLFESIVHLSSGSREAAVLDG
jgi:hypothetical protein